MELVAILRELSRHRLLIVLVALVALVVGTAMAYRLPDLQSRTYEVGIGSVTALVDTPSSQVVDLGGETGVDIATLSARATLLASLMTSSPVKDEIAARAGVDVKQLVTIAPSGPGAQAPSSVSGASVTAEDPEANILKTSIPNLESGEIPIISVDTQAPSAAVAAKLANESIEVLKAHLTSVAGTDRVPEARRVVVRQLGPAQSATVRRGPGKVIAVAVAIVVFGFGLAVILGLSALVRGWRLAAAMDAIPGDEDLYEDDGVFDAEDTAFLADHDEPVDEARPIART